MADNILANHRERTKKPYFTTVCPVDQEVEATQNCIRSEPVRPNEKIPASTRRKTANTFRH